MDDYINREDTIKAFDPNQRRDWYTPWIVETLEDLPSADVAPVRHGRWIESTTDLICSACETAFNYEIAWMCRDLPYGYPMYCPYCGAKMDEVVDDESA